MDIPEEYRPRVIRWQLTRSQPKIVPGEGTISQESIHSNHVLTTQECLLVIDNLSRLSKSIVVLTGFHLKERADLFSIVEYGIALGLKIIVELEPEELSEDLLRQYRHFGPKVLRINANDCIIEDPDERFEHSPKFRAFEESVKKLKSVGYEIHLGVTIQNTDVRALAFYHDYAFRCGADGLYCHLVFDHEEIETTGYECGSKADTFIQAIATMKGLSPRKMYFSPQCVKYGYVDSDGYENAESVAHDNSPWNHWCLAGKSFIFINEEGVVHVCDGTNFEVGSLRDHGYNFEQIWNSSEVLQHLRDHRFTCTQAQNAVEVFQNVIQVDDGKGEKVTRSEVVK